MEIEELIAHGISSKGIPELDINAWTLTDFKRLKDGKYGYIRFSRNIWDQIGSSTLKVFYNKSLGYIQCIEKELEDDLSLLVKCRRVRR